MADIELHCTTCGTVVKISEFADVTTVVCKSCGGKLRKPEKTFVKPRATIRQQRDEPVQSAEEANPQEWRFHKTIEKSKQQLAKADKPKLTHHLISWGVFVVLGAVMYYLRYGDALSEPNFKMLQEYGVFVFFVLYIMIILSAFKDSAFQGILCTLIPGYPLFYLFGVSDEFYMRAVVAGCLIGVGQDSALVIKDKALGMIKEGSEFISSGGGDITPDKRRK